MANHSFGGKCSVYGDCIYRLQELIEKRCWHDVNRREHLAKSWSENDFQVRNEHTNVETACQLL